MTSDYIGVANRLLRAASNAASQQTNEENEFESLVNATRRNFRRSDSAIASPRGRRKKENFSRKVFLTKLSHIDFLPAGTEQRYLKNMGLGRVSIDCYENNNRSILGEANKLLIVNRNANIGEIKESILLLYSTNIQNLLKMSGFNLARCDKSKKICIIENIYNANDLEREVGSGRIIVIPKNDFPNDLPTTNNVENEEHRSVRAVDVREQESLFRVPSPLTVASHSRSSISPIENIYENFNFEDDSANTETVNSSILFLPTLSEDAEEYSLLVSRINCSYEMLNIYTDKSIVTKRLNVMFSNELGLDGGGLTKELFNVFFKDIESKYFRGEDSLVPFLELNKMKEKDHFIIIGRILEHMLLLTGSIPSKLSKIVLMLLADPDRSIDVKLLLDELFSYVNPYLRHLLKKGTQGFGTLNVKEVEIIGDFFQSYKFFELPNPLTFKEQLNIIASEIFIEGPRRLIDLLRKGISLNKYEFWTKCDFGTLLEMQKATPAKVANCIVTDENLTQGESKILHYLDMFIRCLNNEDVGLFVFMVTGSFMMPYSINVKFNDLVGLSQRPVFSTCTDTLMLPRSYATYQDLKNDLNACLQSEEAKIYTSY